MEYALDRKMIKLVRVMYQQNKHGLTIVGMILGWCCPAQGTTKKVSGATEKRGMKRPVKTHI